MKALLILIIVVVCLSVGPAVTMWLWNWLMPVIFGLPTIGFWQALGLLVLTSILFYRK